MGIKKTRTTDGTLQGAKMYRHLLKEYGRSVLDMARCGCTRAGSLSSALKYAVTREKVLPHRPALPLSASTRVKRAHSLRRRQALFSPVYRVLIAEKYQDGAAPPQSALRINLAFSSTSTPRKGDQEHAGEQLSPHRVAMHALTLAESAPSAE